MEGYREYATRPRTVILGSGNVATHLARGLDETTDVVCVWSRTFDNARRLAQSLKKALPTDNFAEIPRDADFYIISVVDDHIADVASALGRDVEGIIAHTSGSYELCDLVKAAGTDRCGVFYPLQTFSKTTDVDLSHIPFFIEGTGDTIISRLSALAQTISDNVHGVDSSVRGHLHIAAVFANNFANYVWDVADNYLREHTDFDISVFSPLLRETLRKAMELGPHTAQTGPARRGDIEIIEKHISALDKDTAEVYSLISDRINKTHHK